MKRAQSIVLMVAFLAAHLSMKAVDSATPGDVTSIVVLDNQDAEFSGKWYSSSQNSDKYGKDYRFAASSNGELTAVAVYRLKKLVPGDYDVEIWYSAAANRSPNAHWVVCHDGHNAAARINQQINGGQWVKIVEAKHFSGGADECIFASNFGTKNTAVVADAVRLVPSTTSATPPDAASTTAGPILLDNEAAIFEGNWASGTLTSQKFGTDYHYALATAGPATASAIYQPTVLVAGKYDVEIYYPSGENRATGTCWIISCETGTITNRITQRISGGSWVKIGKELSFEKGTSGSVKLTNEDSTSAGGVVVADAVRFVPLR